VKILDSASATSVVILIVLVVADPDYLVDAVPASVAKIFVWA
jgi:hypothetical protein